jgi:hypothetical protein
VNLALLLEEARPKLLLQFRLAEDELDIAVSVASLALRWVNLRSLLALHTNFRYAKRYILTSAKNSNTTW